MKNAVGEKDGIKRISASLSCKRFKKGNLFHLIAQVGDADPSNTKYLLETELAFGLKVKLSEEGEKNNTPLMEAICSGNIHFVQ